MVPAKLRPDGHQHSRFEHSLGELMEQALDDPESQEASHALGHFVSGWFQQRDRAESGEIIEETRQFRISFVTDLPRCYLPDYLTLLN